MPNDRELTTAGGILEAALQQERRSADHRTPAVAAEDSESELPAVDEVEDLVATIFSAVLNVDRVPRKASFAALGGDSLMALTILSRVWRAFDVKLPIRSVVPDGSVAAVAEEVRRARQASLPTITSVSRRVAVGKEKASDNQAAIWFLESGHGPGPLYNIPYALRLSGPLDVQPLQDSLQGLLQRHEALRMRFALADGQLLQEPISVSALDLPLADVSGLPDPEAHARELSNKHVRAPFDLTSPPLIKPLLVRLAQTDHLLVLVVHHIVCDAWSIKLLLRELAEAYDTSARQKPTATTPGFLDFIAWQREMLDSDEGKQLSRHWREALSDVDMTPLPTDRPRSQERPYVGDLEPITLDEQLVGDLRRVAGDQGATLYMLLLSAYSIAVGACFGRQDVVVGSPVANREQESMEEVIGYLANTLPMRVRLTGDPTLRELLGRARATALDAYEHQAMPFARLVREIGPERYACNPIFQTALVLNNMTPSPMDGLDVSEVVLHTGTSKLDLTCYLEERHGGGLIGHLEYSTTLLHPQTVRRVRAAFQRALGEIADYIDQPLSEVKARIGAIDDDSTEGGDGSER